MVMIALGQMRRRPAAFVGLAVALFLAVVTVTLFGSLFAADAVAPEADRKGVDGPGLAVIAGAFGEIAVLVAFFVVVNASSTVNWPCCARSPRRPVRPGGWSAVRSSRPPCW